MATRLYKKCVICNRRRMSEPNVFLASLPLDPTRCRLWVQAIGQEDLVHLPIEKLHMLKYVCDKHFAPEDFNRQRNRLMQNAVPKYNLPLPPLPEALFAEFPLHIGQQPKQHQRGVLSDGTNLVTQDIQRQPQQQCSNTPDEVLTLKDGHYPAVASNAVEEIVAVTSNDAKSSKRKFGDLDADPLEPQPSTSTASDDLLVHSYTRKRKSSELSNKNEQSEKEIRLLKRLQNAKHSLQALAKTSINIDKLDSVLLKNILTGLVENQKKKPHGKRWDMKNKISALAIFKRSPRTYRFLQATLPLPSEKTLHRVIKSIPMEPGLNLGIMEMLKKKFNKMEEKDKHCALLFDEIALKQRLIFNESTDKVEGFVDYGLDMGRNSSIADHALVFMIQGIEKKIKQPVAYYFVKGTISTEKLAVIIKGLIKSLTEAGIHILTTVCDQGPTNIGALNLLKRMSRLDAEENYFIVEDKRILIMYDIPHLFKSIRNNFFKAGNILYEGKTGQWRHLIEAEEKNKNFLNFKKLNTTVVNPTYRIKMKVKYAAHALSNTMAAVLKMMAWNRKDIEKKEIMDTAQIIEELDRLFDCTNGPSSQKDKKKGIRENVSKKTNHIQLWNYYLKQMDTIKFLKSNSRLQLQHVRCIKGFKIALRSLKDIWCHLKSKGFKYLNLRQLNQDSLENLFGTIRQHSVTNKNPTCAHFTAALKTSIISGLTGPHNRGSNCDADENKLLSTFNDIISQKMNSSADTITNVGSSSAQSAVPAVTVPEYPTISLPEVISFHEVEANLCSFEQQPVVYVSGYIAAKLLYNSTCDTCKACLKNENPECEEGLYKYISLREWWQDKKSLTYPTKQLCDTIDSARAVFEHNVVHRLHSLNISNLTVLELMVNCDLTWFVCQEHLESVTKMLFSTLAKMFIRKQCKIINSSFSGIENVNADASKKAQQQSTEK